MNRNIFIIAGILFSLTSNSQTIKLDKNSLEAVNVTTSIEKLMGKEVVKAIKDLSVKEVDEPTYVKSKGINFKNGTIEVKVLSRLLKDAPDFASGFMVLLSISTTTIQSMRVFIYVLLMQGSMTR